jgi:hypothetical protein
METKLTVRVSEELLQGAKRYAADHDTTLTRLITAYFERLMHESAEEPHAPIVRRLSGALSGDVSEQDYHHYLEQKYGAG